MSDYDDENYRQQTEGQPETGHDQQGQQQDYNDKEEEKEEKTETETTQAHGHRSETHDGTISSPQPTTKKSATSSISRISIGSTKTNKPTQQQQSMDEDSGIDTDTKKTRRRGKDASADVLNVINWELNGGDKYEGSDQVPEVEERKRDRPVDSGNTEVADAAEEDDSEVFEDEPPPVDKVRDQVTKSSHIVQSTPIQSNGSVTDKDLKDSLDFLSKTPDAERLDSDLLNSLMDSYLDKSFVNRPPTLKKPIRAPPSKSGSKSGSTSGSKSSSRKTSTGEEIQEMKDLEKNLKTIREKNKKQPPPPVRNKPPSVSRAWEDPREQQRLKVKEKQWPPKEPPKDVGAYVVESYGRTDPYTKQLIKDVQRAKRQEVELKEAEKRSEIVNENTQPVKTLRDTFSSKPQKGSLGTLRPQTELHAEKSWIRHEKTPLVYDEAPDEPDWMTLIRNRRWKSTVKARFPCKDKDRTDFERRSTTPKNWKKLAKDKNALRMLSEIVGIGAEGEELFLRLAEQRQKVEEQKEQIDKLAEEDILAYQVARESLGEDAAYSLQMDNPLPAARMKPVMATTNKSMSVYDSNENLPGLSNDALAGYPFTTSQLEAAYLSNQLLRLHPEEFRKLISMERPRQATLRWQFSADPFDSVHEHQNLPYEMALLASDEPRVLQAMRKIVATGTDDYRSVFSSSAPTPQPRSRARSDGGAYNGFYYESDGYESSNSISSSSSIGGVPRGRTKKKKQPVPIPKGARGRSVSPAMMHRGPPTAPKPRLKSASGSTLKVPSMQSISSQQEDDLDVQSHSLFDDTDLQLANEIEDLNRLTSNLSRNIDEDLKGITSTLEDRKKGFFEEAIRNENEGKGNHVGSGYQDIDMTEISNRRKDFVEKDLQSSASSDVRVDLPKTRHKVRRISSNAQLNAVFRKRRQMSEADTSEDQADSTQQQADGNNNNNNNSGTKEQIADVLNDIQTQYGE